MSLASKYPDVKICTAKDCKLSDQEHEIFYKCEQLKENYKKSGTIMPMTEMDGDKITEFFLWWNGKEWVRL